MTRRIQQIIAKFYRIASKKEIRRRKFKNYKRLAWFYMSKVDDTLDVTWDEAQEAAALMLDELD